MNPSIRSQAGAVARNLEDAAGVLARLTAAAQNAAHTNDPEFARYVLVGVQELDRLIRASVAITVGD